MSLGSVLAGPAIREALRSEQRLHRRYAIVLGLQYRLRKNHLISGPGKTVNLSTGGVLFQTRDLLPASGEIDLVIDWPFLLQNTCPLRLVERGTIVRSDEHGIAVRVLSHEFCTGKHLAA